MTPWLDGFDVQARVILQALLNTFWPGLLLVGMTWLGLRAAGRTSASSRSAIWLVNLLVFCTLPWLPTGTARLTIPTSTVAPPLGRLASALAHPAAPVVPVVAPVAPTVAPTVAPPVALAVPVERPPRSLTASSMAGSSIAASPVAVLINRTTGSVDPSASASTARPVGPGSGAESRSGAPSLLGRWGEAVFGGRLPMLLIGVWAAVAAVLLGRIAWSFLYLFILRRRLGLMAASDRARGQALSGIYGIRRRVRFFTSPLVGGPMTIGWVRPLVILPPDIIERLSASELDSILAHELGHIKRWDYLINLLQRAAQAIFFFHPAVWIIGRELSIERELACDDWALKMTGEPRRYATCLTKMIEVLGPARPLALATGIIFGKHVISRRIEMILDRNRNAATSVSKPALLSAFGTAGLAVALCAFFAPVIAVPLSGAQAKAPRPARPAASPATPSAPQAPDAPAPPAAPLPSAVIAEVIDPADLSDLPDLPEAPEPADAPEAPVIEYLEALAPIAIAPRAALPVRNVSYQDVFAVAQGQDLFAVAPVQAPVVASTNRSEPMIPEAELLAVLTDIVKKDSDPSVRTEALRGIYRIRSEAGVNALLGLYDSIPDAKTKGEIIEYLMRREGDNGKAVAKLLQIARTEKDETLRSRALRQLSRVKGDDGANHLIGIYDSLQDPKEKQMLIRYLGSNRSRKAVDKLIQIAKNDTDPNVRQSAIRSLYAIDNNLYLDVRGKGVSNLNLNLNAPLLELNDKLRAIEIDKLDNFKFEWNETDARRLNEEFQKQREEMERQLEEHHEQFESLGVPRPAVRPRATPRPRVQPTPPPSVVR